MTSLIYSRLLPACVFLNLLLFSKVVFALDEQWLSQNTLNDHPCKEDIISELANWQTKHEWSKYSKNRFGDKIYRSPTSKIGYWIELQVRDKNNIKVLRVTPEHIDHIDFYSKCDFTIKSVERNLDLTRMATAFTDKDLENFIHSNPNGGLILAWAPSMPLSQTMIENTQKVADEQNIPLILVVDPHADEASITQAIAENNLVNADRKIESVELIFRGMTTHYPSLLSIKNKEFSSSVVPGVVIEPLVNDFVKEHIIEFNIQAPNTNKTNIIVYWLALILLSIFIGFGIKSVLRREKSA